MLLIEKIETGSGFSLNKGEHILAHQNWVPGGGTKVTFSIRHDGSSIYLYYEVKEKEVRAVNTAINSSVWEDSCVEFFLSLEAESENYYNFEINAIGTVLGAYGPDRNQREWLPESILSKVETIPSLGLKPFDNQQNNTPWNIQIRIPMEVLTYSNLNNLSGTDGYGNFYKCGDKLEHPHFLSWKPVLTSNPDFHTPRYFGHLSFL
jgi:hypothetical protein